MSISISFEKKGIHVEFDFITSKNVINQNRISFEFFEIYIAKLILLTSASAPRYRIGNCGFWMIIFSICISAVCFIWYIFFFSYIFSFGASLWRKSVCHRIWKRRIALVKGKEEARGFCSVMCLFVSLRERIFLFGSSSCVVLVLKEMKRMLRQISTNFKALKCALLTLK